MNAKMCKALRRGIRDGLGGATTHLCEYEEIYHKVVRNGKYYLSIQLVQVPTTLRGIYRRAKKQIKAAGV